MTNLKSCIRNQFIWAKILLAFVVTFSSISCNEAESEKGIQKDSLRQNDMLFEAFITSACSVNNSTAIFDKSIFRVENGEHKFLVISKENTLKLQSKIIFDTFNKELQKIKIVYPNGYEIYLTQMNAKVERYVFFNPDLSSYDYAMHKIFYVFDKAERLFFRVKLKQLNDQERTMSIDLLDKNAIPIYNIYQNETSLSTSKFVKFNKLKGAWIQWIEMTDTSFQKLNVLNFRMSQFDELVRSLEANQFSLGKESLINGHPFDLMAE
jgi:hypothetical protein